MTDCLLAVAWAWWRDRTRLVDWSAPFEHPADLGRTDPTVPDTFARGWV